MSMEIDGPTLATLRKKRGWPQKVAAAKVGISLRQYQRLEAEGKHVPRARIHERICTTFNVDAETLPGSGPLRDSQDHDPIATRINVSVGLNIRNIFFLNTRRYGITLTAQVAWGTTLFALLAEESLQWRRERLARLRESLQRQEEDTRGLAKGDLFRVLVRGAAGCLSAEEETISVKDLFGEHYEKTSNDLRSIDRLSDAIWPFTVFILERLKKYPDVFAPITVAPAGVPQVWHLYSDKEIDRVLGLGGKTEPIEPIVSGFVALHETPQKLLNEGSPDDRAAWIAEHDRTPEVEKELVACMKNLPEKEAAKVARYLGAPGWDSKESP